MLNKKYKNIGLMVGILIVILILFSVKSPVCTQSNLVAQEGTITDEDITMIQDELSIKNINSYHVGMSMYPNIVDGEVCNCIKQDEYKVGDIIMFYIERNNQITFISHRIAGETPNGFITKGDHNDKEDAFIVPRENIFCKIPELSLMDKIIKGDKL